MLGLRGFHHQFVLNHGKVIRNHSKLQSEVKLNECPQVRNSQDVYELLLKNWNDDILMRESFYLMLLNKANRVKGIVLFLLVVLMELLLI